MDAFVQLIRNALCCCKDLHLFEGTFLWDPSYTAEYYRFPKPLNKTTPLELIIAPTQLFACVSTTISGYLLIVDTGVKKLLRVNRLIQMHKSSGTTADRLVDQSLANVRSAALKSIFIGINVMSIGISFFWLFCNSFHITETDWIGGVKGLIHALTVMEVGLVPLLYYMLEDGFELFAKAKRMQTFAAVLKISKSGGMSDETLNAETYSWIVSNGWHPFWADGLHLLEHIPDEVTETKNMNHEISKLNKTLDAISGKQKSAAPALIQAADRLEGEVVTVRMEGYRELLYLVINFIAFYGYLLGIVVFYYDQEEFQPHHVGRMKFWMSNEDADWHGNFAGDLMWTIEPVVILASPMVMTWIKPKMARTAKTKKD